MAAPGGPVLIIGGGVAGLSLGAALAPDFAVTILEAENQPGYHSSGRSVARLHFALGNPTVRALTLASRGFFEAPPEGFAEVALAHHAPALVFASAAERGALDALATEISRYAVVEALDPAGLARLCPPLRLDGPHGAVAGIVDHRGLSLDTDAYLGALRRRLIAHGGQLFTGARLVEASRTSGGWQARCADGRRFTAQRMVNAAGAWADEMAAMAGAAPIGIRPLRRTVILFDGPAGLDVPGLPFAKTVGDHLYFGPEAGVILASPMDEVVDVPSDAQPDEYEVALAAARIEERTTLRVQRIGHRWAGLRSFAPDRLPVVGERPGEEGFFWFAGQGGSGFQTAPALAHLAARLVGAKTLGAANAAMEAGLDALDPRALSPARLD